MIPDSNSIFVDRKVKHDVCQLQIPMHEIEIEQVLYPLYQFLNHYSGFFFRQLTLSFFKEGKITAIAKVSKNVVVRVSLVDLVEINEVVRLNGFQIFDLILH